MLAALDWGDVPTWLQAIAALVVLAPPAFWCVRSIWRHFARVHTLLGTVESMAVEFKTNGGTSLRDAVNRIERNMSFYRAELRQLGHEVELASYTTDEHGLRTWSSEDWLELTQMSLQQAMGTGWKTALHPNDRARIEAEWEACVRDHRIFRANYSYMTLCEDHDTLAVSGYAEPVFDALGNFIGMAGTSWLVQQA